MLSSGNGRPETCVNNLLRTVRGEVPYERLKGMSASIIDDPSTKVRSALTADISWLVKTYEPRAKLDKIDLAALTAQIGDFRLGAYFDIISSEERKGAAV